MTGWVPLSVREGNWRTRLDWRLLGLRERVALFLAPWLDFRVLAPPCPHCGSEATRENPVSAAVGAMLCDDCGCRWRPC